MLKKKKDESDAIARRQWHRFLPSEVPNLKGITINQGNEAQLADISRGGAMIETDVRLHPQMKIILKLITTQGGVIRIPASVLRSSIKSLIGTPVYQSSIAFENPLTMLDDLEKKLAKNDKSAVTEPVIKKNEEAPVIENETAVDSSLSGAETQPEGISAGNDPFVQMGTTARFESPNVFKFDPVSAPVVSMPSVEMESSFSEVEPEAGKNDEFEPEKSPFLSLVTSAPENVTTSDDPIAVVEPETLNIFESGFDTNKADPIINFSSSSEQTDIKIIIPDGFGFYFDEPDRLSNDW